MKQKGRVGKTNEEQKLGNADVEVMYLQNSCLNIHKNQK